MTSPLPLKLLLPVFTALSGGGVFAGILWIVKDQQSRRQIGEAIQNEMLWPWFSKGVSQALKRFGAVSGRPFSLDALNALLAITFYYVVVSLAASEIAGSQILIGDAPLLRRQVSPPGALILVSAFALILGFIVLATWRRQGLVRRIADVLGKSEEELGVAHLVYWIIVAGGWLLLAVLVKAVSSDDLFSACLVIGGLSLLGSISRLTRIGALLTALVLPFVLIVIWPQSPVGLILAFLYVATTPVKGLWDWLSVGVTTVLVRRLMSHEPGYGRLARHLGLSLVWCCAAVVGVAFSLGLSFQLFSKIVSSVGGTVIDWRPLFDDSLHAPAGRGLFLTILCVTTVIPALGCSCVGALGLLVAPLPGKRKIGELCARAHVTALERAAIVGYLWLTAMVLVMGAMLLCIAVWLAAVPIGRAVFFGALDLVKQLL